MCQSHLNSEGQDVEVASKTGGLRKDSCAPESQADYSDAWETAAPQGVLERCYWCAGWWVCWNSTATLPSTLHLAETYSWAPEHAILQPGLWLLALVVLCQDAVLCNVGY